MNTIDLDDVPGYASQVWAGWVWMTGSDEHAWSKRPTREQCEQVVRDAVERLGVEGALGVDEFDTYHSWDVAGDEVES